MNTIVPRTPKAIEFVMEKGVEIPKESRGPKGGIGENSIYPFSKMEIGDSLFFKGPLTKKQLTRLVGAWGRITKLLGYRYVSRRMDNGIRVWRVDPATHPVRKYVKKDEAA